MSDFATPADIVAAMAAAGAGGPGCRQDFNKNSLSASAGVYHSGWIQSGFPGAGSAPGAWSHPTASTPGSWAPFLVAGGTKTNRLLLTEVTLSNAGQNFIWADRIGHMGGLNGTLTTAQTVGATLTGAVSDGRCAADGSDVQWFLEVYSGLGSTAVTATVAVTYHDDSTGNISVSIPASVVGSRLMSILPTNGKWIKAISSVTLSASTGSAGSFGVTAFKRLASNSVPSANFTDKSDWAYLGMPKVPTNACICPFHLCVTGSIGTVLGTFVIGAA